MTNSLRGAVSFEVDGASHVLRFSFNAQVRYQDAAGEAVEVAVPRALQHEMDGHGPDLRRIRRLFWAGLSHEGLTEEEAGDIIEALGRQPALDLLGQAIKLAFPQFEEKAAKPGKRKAAAPESAAT